MAKYFNNFPKLDYAIENNGLQYVTNIVSRFGLDEKLKQNSSIYYTYDISDGDTPEILAAKIYDSPEKHWIILAMNDIVDPQFDWPLTYDQFNRYVEEKYSQKEYADTANTNIPGLIWSQNINNIHAYYKVVTKQINDTITIDRFEVDANTYANNIAMDINSESGDTYNLQDGSFVNIKITKTSQNYYDYEKELNENKRTIKMLKVEFVPYLENELLEIFE
jgi:hypothetical protein